MAVRLSSFTEPAMLSQGNIENTTIEVDALFNTGPLTIVTHRSAMGSYIASIDMSGQIALYRGEQLLNTVTIAALQQNQRYTIRLTTRAGTVSLDINGEHILSAVDSTPLPSGGVVLYSFGDVLLSHLRVYGDVTVPIPIMSAASIQNLQVPNTNSGAIQSLSASENKIAFAAGDFSGYDVFLMDDDGTDIIPITSTSSVYNLYPSISPDGSSIVYSSDSSGNTELYIYDVATSTTTQLTSTSLSENRPDWSPDGTQIVYEASGDIYVITVSSGVAQNLGPSQFASSPKWSPDGTKIIFTADLVPDTTILFELHTMNTSGGSITTLTSGGAGSPDWSPDGNEIVYVNTATPGLAVISDTGTFLRQLTTTGGDSSPSWSPDGSLIVFRRSSDLQVISSTGGSVTNITNSSTFERDPDWGLPYATPTPTATPTNTPTPTPTYAPFTSLDFTGQHSGLKAVIFWAIFNESSSDNFDSGSFVDNFDLGNPRFTSFLFNSPYCSPGSVPGDNAAESPFQTSGGDWYIRHCPYDYRYMVAQTMFNGFLNYERRFGTNSAFEYAEQNFGGSIGNTSYSLWLISTCQVNSYGTSYAAARASSSQSTAYANAIGWLTEYMTCLANLSTSDYTPTRVQRAYQNTVWPQINASVSDFYSLPTDPTDGAFSALAANFGNGSLGACVGGCTLQCTGSVIYEFEASPGTFVCFATPAGSITQSQVNTAYNTHIQQISPYIPNYDSVSQPILRVERDLSTGAIVGYIWYTAVYQQSADMSHVPR